MPRLSLRKATVQDFDDLCLLFQQIDDLHLSMYPNVFQPFDGDPRSLEQIMRWIKNPQSDILIVEKGEGELIGALKVIVEETPDYPNFVPQRLLLVDEIIVDTNYQGEGIGTLLMEEAKEWALQNNLSRIELNVYEKNERSLRFYEKLGFETFKRRMSFDLKKDKNEL